jgi:hypothetical protein
MAEHDFRHAPSGGRVEASIGDDGHRVVSLIEKGGPAYSHTSTEDPLAEDFPVDGKMEALLVWGVGRLEAGARDV